MNNSEILKNISYLKSFVKVDSVPLIIVDKLNQNKNLKIIYVESTYENGNFHYHKKIYDGSFSVLVEPNGDTVNLTIYFDIKDINVVEIFLKQLIK